jgi:hypothetical protein
VQNSHRWLAACGLVPELRQRAVSLGPRSKRNASVTKHDGHEGHEGQIGMGKTNQFQLSSWSFVFFVFSAASYAVNA